jgi:hypothetical protein
MLKCITCYFNINNSVKVKENYIKFRQNFNAPLITVELAFDNQEFFIEDSIKIRGNSSHLMWQKERLLNIAIESLPDKVDKIAWVDADIIFDDPKWFKKTEEKLESFKAVQLFQEVYELNSYNDPVNNGYGYVYNKRLNPEQSLDKLDTKITDNFGKVGLGWAMQRSSIPFGINDYSINGTSDLYQILSWEGAWDNYYYQLLPPKYRLEMLTRGFQDFVNIRKNISYIDVKIQHLEHGTRSNRNYFQHQKALYDNDFNIAEDLEIDPINKLWKWKRDNHKLHQDIANIFYTRYEDGATVYN